MGNTNTQGIEARDVASRAALDAFALLHGLEVADVPLWTLIEPPEPPSKEEASDRARAATGRLPGGALGSVAYVATTRLVEVSFNSPWEPRAWRYVAVVVPIRAANPSREVFFEPKKEGGTVARCGEHSPVPMLGWGIDKALKKRFKVRSRGPSGDKTLNLFTPRFTSLLVSSAIESLSVELVGPKLCVSVPQVLKGDDSLPGSLFRNMFSHRPYPDAALFAQLCEFAAQLAECVDQDGCW